MSSQDALCQPWPRQGVWPDRHGRYATTSPSPTAYSPAYLLASPALIPHPLSTLLPAQFPYSAPYTLLCLALTPAHPLDIPPLPNPQSRGRKRTNPPPKAPSSTRSPPPRTPQPLPSPAAPSSSRPLRARMSRRSCATTCMASRVFGMSRMCVSGLIFFHPHNSTRPLLYVFCVRILMLMDGCVGSNLALPVRFPSAEIGGRQAVSGREQRILS